MAWYRTGTITVTNGSATVTGAGTAFVANVRAGYGIVAPDGKTYEVLTVNSDTSLTLAVNYLGATASGQSYAIFPTQSVIADLTTQVSSLISSFVAVRDGVGVGLNPDGSAATPAIRFSSDQDTGLYRPGSNRLGFATGGTARAEIDASGNFLISGNIRVTVADGAYSNALEATNGNLRLYPRYDSTAGAKLWAFSAAYAGEQVLTLSGSSLRVETGGGSLSLAVSTSSIRPGVDNAASAGTSSFRYTVVYAATGTINTSDERDKTWRGELTDEEYAAGLEVLGELGFYQWNEAIEEKGHAARLHFGARAQRVWSIFAAHGLVDPIDQNGRPGVTPYAFLCWDEWEERREPVFEEVPVTKTRIALRATSIIDPDTQQPAMVEVEEPYEATERRPTGQTSVELAAGNRFGLRPEGLTLFLLAVQARRQGEIEARLATLEAA